MAQQPISKLPVRHTNDDKSGWSNLSSPRMRLESIDSTMSFPSTEKRPPSSTSRDTTVSTNLPLREIQGDPLWAATRLHRKQLHGTPDRLQRFSDASTGSTKHGMVKLFASGARRDQTIDSLAADNSELADQVHPAIVVNDGGGTAGERGFSFRPAHFHSKQHTARSYHFANHHAYTPPTNSRFKRRPLSNASATSTCSGTSLSSSEDNYLSSFMSPQSNIFVKSTMNPYMLSLNRASQETTGNDSKDGEESVDRSIDSLYSDMGMPNGLKYQFSPAALPTNEHSGERACLKPRRSLAGTAALMRNVTSLKPSKKLSSRHTSADGASIESKVQDPPPENDQRTSFHQARILFDEQGASTGPEKSKSSYCTIL